MKFFIVLSVAIIGCLAQRSPYMGRLPIGYPVIQTPSTESALGDRFGEDGVPITTQRLPIEALGDKELVDRLKKMPLDHQPFWFINWKALEAERQNPHSYAHSGNSFIDNPRFNN